MSYDPTTPPKNAQPYDLASARFQKKEGETESCILDVVAGTIVPLQGTSQARFFDQKWFAFAGHRLDFLKLAKTILSELEPSPDRMLDSLHRIEKLLEKQQNSS